jgi:amino acid permease
MGRWVIISQYPIPNGQQTEVPAHISEYWLSSLKVLTILIFILTGIAVNLGANPAHEVIGFTYWRLPGAPFVGGFGGFVKVFVTASFACEYFHSLFGYLMLVIWYLVFGIWRCWC